MGVAMTIVIKELYLSYYHSCNLLEILPRVLMMGSIMPWAGLFDRVGAIRFRVFNSVVWGGGAVFGGIGAFVLGHYGIDTVATFTIVVTAVALARVSQGLGMGGGAIAWTIGHLHFAEPEKAEIYMGIHVTLTGVRGLAAPFLGAALYVAFGWPVFAVALALSIAGTLSFRALAKAERHDRRSAASEPAVQSALQPAVPLGSASAETGCLSARES